MSNQVISESKERMEKCVKSLQTELSKFRTGRASLVILDGIKVNYYGTPTPLNQVATLAVPEPRLISIQPWESNLIPEIESAIQKANLGINPTSDGKIIRLPIPKLTEERRKEIVKQVKSQAEEARVSIRHVRRDANENLKKLQKDSKISEDEFKRGQEGVQKLTDEYIARVEQILGKKEEDVMTV